MPVSSDTVPPPATPGPAPPSWAEYWVLPGLITAMVVGNQGWQVGPFLAGQMISWTVNLAAFIVLVRCFPRRAWPWLLLAGIVLAKAISGAGVAGGRSDTLYKVLLNAQFCAAGAVVAYRFVGLALVQLRWICLASVIMMVFQVTGTGEWTQFLATENEGRPITAQPTLFVPHERLAYQTIQARPSGLLHSNNFLSLVVLFALALQWSSKLNPRLNRWDLVLCAMVVLSMAKIVFLVTAIFLAWMLIMGTPPQRIRMRKAIVLLIVLFSAYRVLMPGQFESQINTYHITYSFYIRINDVLDRLDPRNPLVTVLSPWFVHTPRLDRDAGEIGFSGYAQALKLVPFIAIGLLLLLPLLRRGLRFVRLRMADLSSVPVLTAIVALVYPGAVPFLTAQIYWFVVGFAGLPLFLLLMSRSGAAQRRRAPSRRVRVTALIDHPTAQ
jgi:hypothetical protein